MDEADRVLETTLLLQAQAGDPAAFRELVARFDSPLRYFARRLLDDAAAADDVVQDVWLAALRQINGIRSGAALRVWLFQVARNRANSHLRFRIARMTASVDELADVPDDDEPSFLLAEQAADIHRGLAALSVEHREVLALRFLEDMSYDDIAGVIGCSIGTVRSRLHYAKKSLLEAIHEITDNSPARS